MPYRAEVVAHRRARRARALERVERTAYFRTKAEARRAMKDEADRLAADYAQGGDFHFGIRFRVRKGEVPTVAAVREPPARRAPAFKDAAGRYRSKSGAFLSKREALRRNRISRSLRKRFKAERRAKRKARQRLGTWGEASTDEGTTESPPLIGGSGYADFDPEVAEEEAEE